jgi:EmrB/QacA subfamily drug resistance transporter
MQSRRFTLAVVCVATAMLMLDIAVVNTALSSIAADLHTGLSGLQWVVDAYTLALAATVLTAGSLADRFGRRRLFTVGLSIFTLASLACTFAGDIAMLNTARAVQGIGAAIMFAVSLAILANAFPETRERVKALSIYGATIGASFAVGPLVGGALTSGLGWRWIFAINLPLGLICLAITRSRVEESRDPAAPRVDWAGQALLAGGLFALVFALLRGNGDGWGSPLIVGCLAAAAVLIALFIAVERRVAQPMLPLGLFRSGPFTAAQVVAFAISGSLFAVYLYTTIYLQHVVGLSPVETGLAYLPGTVICFFVSGATATLGERFAPRTLLVIGLGLVAVGQALLTQVGTGSNWLAIEPGMIIAMAGTGLVNPTLSGLALGSVPDAQSGLAAGVNDTFRQAGIAVGVAGLGALVPTADALSGGAPQAFVDGLHSALLAGALLAGAGALATAVLLNRRRVASAVRRLAPATMVIAGLAVAMLIAGCSTTKTVPKAEVAKQTQAKFDAIAQAKGQAKFPKIVCPDDLKAKAGQSTRCSATGRDGTLGITVTVTSVSGSTAHLNFRGDSHVTKK